MRSTDKTALMNTDMKLSDSARTVSVETEERAALQAHLAAQIDRLRETEHDPDTAADARMEIAHTLLRLERGAESWNYARQSFDTYLANKNWQEAVKACNLLFQSEQSESLAALGMGVWLAVTFPIDVETSVSMLQHIIDETPDDADGAAVTAATAQYIAELRCNNENRDNWIFFTGQMLGAVARRHSQVETQEAFSLWMEKLELNDPEKFLIRLRNVIDVLVQDQWWFSREDLQAALPIH